VTDPARRRRAREVDQRLAWLSLGRGGIHFENIRFIPPLVDRALRLMGLFDRAVRQAARPRMRHVILPCPRLPDALEGFTILHLSDLHLDGMPGLSERVIDLIQDLQADLCVLTGDYRFDIFGPCDNAAHHLGRLIPALKARLGVYGVLGNHDFAELVPALEGLGVTVLSNRGLTVGAPGASLWLAGVDDPHYYQADDLPAALAGRPSGAFTILLAHSPELFREAGESGVDTYLCGHTHGGQFRLPIIGPIWTNASCPRRMTLGAWTHRGVRGYTHAGTGSSGVAARLNCPPEVVLLQLVKDRGERRNHG
jgi:predicted MPP superfamily phosphohydrolase